MARRTKKTANTATVDTTTATTANETEQAERTTEQAEATVQTLPKAADWPAYKLVVLVSENPKQKEGSKSWNMAQFVFDMDGQTLDYVAQMARETAKAEPEKYLPNFFAGEARWCAARGWIAFERIEDANETTASEDTRVH